MPHEDDWFSSCCRWRIRRKYAQVFDLERNYHLCTGDNLIGSGPGNRETTVRKAEFCVTGDGEGQSSVVPVKEGGGLIRDRLKRKNSQAWLCI